MGRCLGAGCYIGSTLSSVSGLAGRPRSGGAGPISVIDNTGQGNAGGEPATLV